MSVREVTVRAAVLEAFGKPFQIREMMVPVEEGDAVLEVRATGICGRDRVIWKGGFRGFPLPAVLGHEFVGEVEGRPMAAYPVITCGRCRYCRTGRENLCPEAQIYGEGRPGGYADRVVLPRSLLFPLPDRRYPLYAAGLCPVATALHALKKARVRPGMSALVTGAGGGVGWALVQVLRARGLTVFAATSPAKAEALETLGVYPVVSSRYRNVIREVDVVFENVGSLTINESLRVLRPQGTLVLIGNIAGTPVEIRRPALTIMREHRIVGSAAFTRREYEEAARWIARGSVRLAYEVFPLEAVNEAYRRLEARQVQGRAVLVPGGAT